jgi:hypothetical protein
VLVTFVLRLVPDRLRDGEIVGEVEHVGDGGHSLVRDTSDLLRFAQRVADEDIGYYAASDGQGLSQLRQEAGDG